METNAGQLYDALLPLLVEMEAQRVWIKRSAVRRVSITIPLLAFIGFCCDRILQESGYTCTIFLPLFGLMFWINSVKSSSNKLNAVYKEQIIPRIVAAICEKAEYRPKEGIAKQVFCDCALFSAPDRYASEDLITGLSGETHFSFSEVHAEEKRTSTSSKGRTTTHWVDIFRGFLFVADFNKDFRGRTVLTRDSLFHFSTRGERARLEDPDFEKRFDVFTTDQIEARYILSPSLMKRITELDEALGGRITLSFYNSSLVVAIPDYSNHFEASLWRTLLNKPYFERECDLIVQLVGIVDDLNLNLRIWTKR